MAQQEQQSDQKQSEPGRYAVWALIVAAVLVSTWLLTRQTGPAGPELVPWRQTFDAGLAEARANGKPMVLDFAADWCPPCRQMVADAYSKQYVADRITAAYVPVKVDMTNPGVDAQRTAEHYGVQYLPTLVITTADGKELARKVGYVDTSELLSWLDATRQQLAADRP